MTQDAERDLSERYAAFAGDARITAGSLTEAALAAQRAQAEDAARPVLVFDSRTGRVVDLDLRGTEADVRARYAPPPARRGRPKLGVTAREVTLLPRHWDWLAEQPGGASVTLRRLVEAARKADPGDARARNEAAYRFLSAMAGNRPGFEEAIRALFAGDHDRLESLIAAWPADIGDEALRILGVGAAPQSG